MSIDIFSIEPNQVSRDLREKIVTIFGNPKTGKTTNAVAFPKSILLAAEKGYNALPGVMAQPIHKWSDFKKVLRQLQKDEAKDKFETVVLDTIDIFFDMAEKFICQREGVELIGDIPYGAGYKMLRTEFSDALRSIPMMDYALVMISHAHSKTVTDSNGKEYSKIVPTLADRPRGIVLGMSDIIGYAEGVDIEGKRSVVLHLRESARFEAGSRFRYTPETIPFTYDALVNAIADAIEKEAEENSGAVTDEVKNAYQAPESKNFEEVKDEINEVIGSLLNDKTGEEQEALTQEIKDIIEGHLGKGRLLAEATKDQQEHAELILLDLQDLLKQ